MTLINPFLDLIAFISGGKTTCHINMATSLHAHTSHVTHFHIKNHQPPSQIQNSTYREFTPIECTQKHLHQDAGGMNRVGVAHPLTHHSVRVCYSSCCFHTTITSSLPGFAFVHLPDWQYTHHCNQNVNPRRGEARQTGGVCITLWSTVGYLKALWLY